MAKDTQVNTWEGGMNKDIAPHKMPPNTYFELREGKVITSEQGNSYGISPVKGNKKVFGIPRIPATFILGQTEQEFATVSVIFVDSNGVTQFVIAFQLPEQPLESLYLALLEQTPISDGIADGSLSIQYSEDYNTIYITLNNEDPVNQVTVQTGGTVTVISQEPHSPEIIGGGDFNDDFVIFTTSENTWGQIWLALYDETSETITNVDGDGNLLLDQSTLKYNGPLNLSKNTPIRRVKSVIEVPNEYGSIYWTDALNPIRVLNLYDDKSLNIPIGQLSLQTSTTFGNLQINKILSTGTLPSGSTVQFTYRLVSESGAKTQYAPLTGLVPLTDSNSYQIGDEYEGTTQDENTLVNKSVSLDISNLDTSYSRIDIAAVVYRFQGIPEVFLDVDIAIPGNSNINYTFTGNNSSNIDVLELNNSSAQIVSANDLAVKDNRLIAFGIKTRPDDLDFETRALSFRRATTGEFTNEWVSSVYNNISQEGIGTFDYTSLNNGTLDMPSETSDCINPSWITKKDNLIGGFNDEGTVNFSDEGIQCFNPFNSVQGGWGPNISFNLIGAELIAFPTLNSFNNNPGTFNGELELHENEIVNFSGEIANFKSPKVSAYLKGYKRGETYRFGIKFFDKYGVPYPVKWICDYRFPDQFNRGDLDEVQFRTRLLYSPGNETVVTPNTFDITNNDFSNQKSNLESFGIKFEINNLDQIRDKISGFTIVRAERDINDRSILASGLLNPSVERDGFNGDKDIIVPTSPDLTTLYAMDGGGSDPITINKRNLNFTTPLSHNLNEDINYSEGDYLVVTNRISSLLTASDDTDGFTLQTSTLYGFSTNSISAYQILPLRKSRFKSFDDVSTFNPNTSSPSNHIIFPNKNELPLPQTTSGSGNVGYVANILGYGMTAADEVFRVTYNSTTNKHWLNIDDDEDGLVVSNELNADRGLYFAEYCRDIYDTQYGGYTYQSRQNNTSYIDCSSFVNANKDQVEVKVFGGDTTVHAWDVYWGAFNYIKFDASQEVCHGVKLILPIESSYNLEYRSEARAIYDYDDHRNAQNNPYGLGRGIDPIKFSLIEDYNYNNAYAQSNIINQSIAKSTISKTTNNLPSSIWASEPKILGEVVDSWRTFLPNNLYDLDAIYGPINRAEILQNNIITIQDEAVAIVPINERVMINDETSTALTLGTGDVIGRHNYITTTSGSKQPFSVVQSDRGIYYFDTRNKKLNRINQGKEPLSVFKGMDSYFRDAVSDSLIINEFNPLNNIGIVSEIDRETDRVHISLLGINKEEVLLNGETVVFNERSDTFEYLSKHAPRLILSNSSILISPDPSDLSQGYLENKGAYSQYYENVDLDNPYKTEMYFYINKNAPLSKTFNNIQYHLEGNDNITRINVNTIDQSSDNNVDIRKRFRIYRHTIGRNQGTKERMMGPWALVRLQADNTFREYFLLHDVVSYFDIYNLGAQ